jgi:hypothetical protein
VKNSTKGKTLRQLGEWLQKKVLGPFVYVFLILAVVVSYGVVSYGKDEGVGVDREKEEKVIGQMVNEVADRCDV